MNYHSLYLFGSKKDKTRGGAASSSPLGSKNRGVQRLRAARRSACSGGCNYLMNVEVTCDLK